MILPPQNYTVQDVYVELVDAKIELLDLEYGVQFYRLTPTEELQYIIDEVNNSQSQLTVIEDKKIN